MNWKQRLKRAENNKCFTEEDLKLASLWATCPISEFADRIELRHGRAEEGPIDIYLVLDGIYFTKGIEEDNVDLAVNCYKSIANQVDALENGTDRMAKLERFLHSGG